ncbi:hypothetical protein BGZ75_009701 [Mortierella antarctica]|nr:hypothetical protein BGZ75_009701 [Mortierella antarctica]
MSPGDISMERSTTTSEPPEEPEGDDELSIKRFKNTLAARRSRAKKVMILEAERTRAKDLEYANWELQKRVLVLETEQAHLKAANETKRLHIDRLETELAHALEKIKEQKTGLTTAAILYLDGAGPRRKQQTLNDRTAKCREALKRAEKALATRQDRVRTGKRVRKHHFNNVVQNAKGSFRWSNEERRLFAAWMRQAGWTVITSPFEADVAIASDCTPSDVVVSIDSDYFGYRTVHTILRPYRGNFRKYDVSQVMAQLGLSRDLLTALCVVSKNDYTSNITGSDPRQISS